MASENGDIVGSANSQDDPRRTVFVHRGKGAKDR